MTYKRHILLGIVSLWLAITQGMAAMPDRHKPEGAALRLADSDFDGVDDTRDLCSGTPLGTIVNAYGCPVTVAQCDYSTSTVTLASTGGSTGGGISTSYVLADNTGKILQISNTATFMGLTGTATYMALALTYNGTVSNLSVNQQLSAVSASCFDWSNAFVFKACVASLVCDYQIGQTITLKTAGGSSGAGVKTSYVLTDINGKLIQISTTPSFSTVALVAGNYRAYALTYTNDNTIVNLNANNVNTLNSVSASCFNWSEPLSLKICVAPPTTCDYNIGQTITLHATGGSSGAGTKTSYVLTDINGKLLQTSTTPSFPTTGLAAGTYQVYALTYTDNNTIANLVVNGSNNIRQVTASCLGLSVALPVTLCVCSGLNKCIPILVTRSTRSR